MVIIKRILSAPMNIFIHFVKDVPDTYPIGLTMLVVGLTAIFEPRFIFSGKLLLLGNNIVEIYGALFIFCAGRLWATPKISSAELKLWCFPLVLHCFGVLVTTTAYIVAAFYFLSLYFVLKYIYVKENEESEIPQFAQQLLDMREELKSNDS